MFAANMAKHIMMHSPTEGNRGFISSIEHLTNDTPDLRHLRVPFSPTYVDQPKAGSLSCRAERGILCGYPEHTRDGVWHSYMHGSGCVHTIRHIVFDEYSNFGADDTAEQKAKRTSILAAAVAALPKRDSASSAVI
jgi:hypothetical protein